MAVSWSTGSGAATGESHRANSRQPEVMAFIAGLGDSVVDGGIGRRPVRRAPGIR